MLAQEISSTSVGTMLASVSLLALFHPPIPLPAYQMSYLTVYTAQWEVLRGSSPIQIVVMVTRFKF